MCDTVFVYINFIAPVIRLLSQYNIIEKNCLWFLSSYYQQRLTSISPQINLTHKPLHHKRNQQGDHCFRKIIFHEFSKTFPYQANENHDLSVPHFFQKQTTYDCIRISSNSSSCLYWQEDKTTDITTYLKIFHNSLSNTTFTVLKLLKLMHDIVLAYFP